VITFVLIAAVMVAAALAWVLVPLLRGARPAGMARETSNVAILRDQLAELDVDLANGVIPPPQYEQARRELEQRVLEDSKPAPGAGAAAPSAASAWTAAILAGALPIVALLLYLVLGNHDAFSPLASRTVPVAAEATHDITPQQVADMAAKLAARLENEPDNAEGWVMLARTYYTLNRHADAVRAFERAAMLVPDNAELLADYADALGAAQGGPLSGKPLALVQRALKIDPTQWKALALAGTAAFDRKDYRQAVAYWERVKATVPPGSPIAQSIDSSIAEARALGGLEASVVAAAPPTATGKVPATPAAGATGRAAAGPPTAAAAAALPRASVSGTVKLAPGLATKAAPNDTVFIFARAAAGSKMPLAVLRKQVKDLPATFTLDDAMAMAPNMALSNFGEVVVGARISQSGNAAPQSGDLEGLSPTVKVGASRIDIVIDHALP
jgi:cytochrome c-type biogenesis protein CcmH